MILDKIRESLEKKREKVLHFIYNGSRNQIEEFDGKILKTYKYIFVIKSNESDIIKSFSYSDILIGTLIILSK